MPRPHGGAGNNRHPPRPERRMEQRHATALLWAILTGVIAGGICGALFSEFAVAWGWIGDLFLDALKMTIIPLIVAAVISGVAALGGVRKLGRVGGLTVAYYATTTAIAVGIGLLLVNL